MRFLAIIFILLFNQYKTFAQVEEPAETVGGMEVFYNYIFEKLEYPESALQKGIEGKVFVQFIVEKSGSLSNIEIIKGIHPECDEEALRLINLFNKDIHSPMWEPGKLNGQDIRQKLVVPIHFKLSREDEGEE